MEASVGLHLIHHLEGLDQRREIGRGSFGAVYEVKMNGLPCIAKGLHDILLGHGRNLPVRETDMEVIRAKFHKECALLGNLKHPNIVQFLGVHQLKDDELLVMEYMHMDLAKCLEMYPDIPLPLKLSILQDVSYGLLHLHSQAPSIIHRDLTARNILLTQGMSAKIADLGVSKVFDIRQVQRSAHTTAPGTWAYMPPEALSPRPKYDAKLDVFSYGVLTLYVANQEFPIVHEPPIPSRVTKKQEIQIYKRKHWMDKMGVAHPLYSVVMSCLKDRPDHRPTSKELNDIITKLCIQHDNSCKNVLELIKENEEHKAQRRNLEMENMSKTQKLIKENEELKAQSRELEMEIELKTQQVHSRLINNTMAPAELYGLRVVRPKFLKFRQSEVRTSFDVTENGTPCIAYLLKTKYSTLFTEADSTKELDDECKRLSKLRHSNILQHLGVHYDKGGHAIITEQLYTSLDVYLASDQDGDGFPISAKLSVLRDVARGLQYLRSQSPIIVHRELFAENVHLGFDMRAKISVVGISIPFDTDRVKSTDVAIYLPPEASEVGSNPLHVDTKWDIYSFGILSIYTVMHKLPSKGEGVFEWMNELGMDHPLYNSVCRCVKDYPPARLSIDGICHDLDSLCEKYPYKITDILQLLQCCINGVEAKCDHMELMKKQKTYQSQPGSTSSSWYGTLAGIGSKVVTAVMEKVVDSKKYDSPVDKDMSQISCQPTIVDENEWLGVSKTKDIARLNQVIESKNRLISELQKNKADLKSIDRCNKDDIHEGLREHGHTCVPQDGRLAEGSNDANLNGLLQKLKVTEERMLASEESYRSALTQIEVITAERDIFADDFRKERDDRSRVAGEKGQVAAELEEAQQIISEMSAKLSSAIKEIDHFSAGLRQTTDELNRTKEEVAVKVAQVKQYQKQVEAYKLQLEQNNEQTQAFRQQLDHMSKLKEQAEKRNNEKTQAFVQQLDHMGMLKEQAEKRLTEVIRGSDTKKPMDLEFKPSFLSGTPIAASHSSTSEEDRAAGTCTSLRAVGTGLGYIVSPRTCLPASVAGMQHHPLPAPPTGSDRVPSPSIFSPQPPFHAGPPSLDNLPHPSAMGGSQGISYPTLDQHQDEYIGSGEPTAPPDPNLTCPQCRLVFKKGEIQKFRLHVQECKHSK